MKAWLILTPVDTWFFRDSQPFNMGEGGNNVLQSLFPPAPMTVAGMLKAVFGADNKRRIGGPYVVRGDPDDPGSMGMLYPFPRRVLQRETADGKEEFALLSPGQEHQTDLAGNHATLLPELPEASRSPPSGEVFGLEDRQWTTAAGMGRILSNQIPLPEDVISEKKLWDIESHTGIRRNRDSRTTETGALFSTRHVRLRRDVHLACRVVTDREITPPGGPVPFGGEGRMAWLTVVPDGVLKFPERPEPRPNGGFFHYTVTLLTPGLLAWGSERPGQPLEAVAGGPRKHVAFKLPGEVVSACTDRAQRLSGFSVGGNTPLELKAARPPGCVWFMKAEATPENQVRLQEMHGSHIGKKTKLGYGQILIGTWGER